MRLCLSSLLALLFAFSATPALATDGVLEINQTCAVQTGCFTGDGAGFPVTITATGSYRLTGNLTVTTPPQSVSAIVISADNVSLDLNGFLVSVDGFGPGRGIESANVGISVSNGSLKSSNVNGTPPRISLGDSATVTRVRVEATGNPSEGVVTLGDNCRITDSVVVSTGYSNAISTGQRCYLSGNVANGGSNACCAIGTGDGSVVVNNVARSSEVGISAGSFSLIVGNDASGFQIAGIRAGSSSTLVDNVIRSEASGLLCGNNCTLRGNTVTTGIDCGTGCSILNNTNTRGGAGFTTPNGILCAGACTVSNNVVNDSDGFGLYDPTGTTGYSGNQFNNNNGGNANPQVSGGIEIGTNICGGDTTCP